MSKTPQTETISFTPDRDQPVMGTKRAAPEPASIVKRLLEIAVILARSPHAGADTHDRQKHKEREIVYREHNDQFSPTEWS